MTACHVGCMCVGLVQAVFECAPGRSWGGAGTRTTECLFVAGVSGNQITGEKLGEFGQGIGGCQQLSSLTLALHST